MDKKRSEVTSKSNQLLWDIAVSQAREKHEQQLSQELNENEGKNLLFIGGQQSVRFF
jgi:hypothetical protein